MVVVRVERAPAAVAALHPQDPVPCARDRFVVGGVAVAGEQHADHRGVVHVGVVVVGVLEGPSAGRHVRAAHRPVAPHVQYLPLGQPLARRLHRGAGHVAAEPGFGHGHAGERGVPDRRDARLHVGALPIVDDQLPHREPGEGGMRVRRLVAEGREHHHAVGHCGVDGAQAVFAVQPLGHEGHGLRGGARPHLVGEQPLTPLEHDVQRLEGMAPIAAVGAANIITDTLGRPGEQFAYVHVVRVHRARAQRHQHQQRHDDGARPVGNLRQVEEEPLRQQHDLHRHGGDGAPGHLAEQRQLDAAEHVDPFGAAGGQDRRPGARHVRRVRAVAQAFQGEIRLHAGRQVEGAAVEQRPAAMRALDAAQVHADACLKRRIDPVQVMLEQDVLGRNRRVGFQLEAPMAVGVLPPLQRARRPLDAVLQGRKLRRRHRSCQGVALHTRF